MALMTTLGDDRDDNPRQRYSLQKNNKRQLPALREFFPTRRVTVPLGLGLGLGLALGWGKTPGAPQLPPVASYWLYALDVKLQCS